MERFTRFFPDDETVEDWCTTWGEELSNLTGPEIKFGLSILAREHPWPPTMAEFSACCKASPKPILPMLEAPKHGKSAHQEACMEKIRTMLENPRKPGIWWAYEVIGKAEIGEKVTLAALELAKGAIARKEIVV